MAVVFEIPGVLRRFSGGLPSIEVRATSVRTALDAVFERFPDLRSRVLDRDGRLFPYLLLFLDGRELPRDGLLDAALPAACALELVGAAEGG